MSPDFTPVGARARGLSAHLFTRAELEALASQELPALTHALARSPRLRAPVIEPLTTTELERALRLTARHHLRTLSKWDGAAPVLGVFFADQDRRALRALLRGALATAPAEERLAGLMPTPTLPERVLSELARQPTPAAVAAHLFALGHPDGARLSPLAAAAQPELLALELALNLGYAERAAREAARGDENLRRFVALRLDLANLQTALVLASATDIDAGSCFIEGGRALAREAFVLASTAGGEVRARLRKALAHTALSPLLEETPLDAARLDRGGFALALKEQRRVARVEPLTSAPVLVFLLRLEAQLRDVRRLLWGAALGAPAALLVPDLVMP